MIDQRWRLPWLERLTLTQWSEDQALLVATYVGERPGFCSRNRQRVHEDRVPDSVAAKDGEKLFKWLRRAAIGTGVSVGSVAGLSHLLEKFPETFAWLQRFIH